MQTSSQHGTLTDRVPDRPADRSDHAHDDRSPGEHRPGQHLSLVEQSVPEDS